MIRAEASGLEQQFDVCIIGAGPAGIAAAEALAEEGKKVCILESGIPPDAVETDHLSIKPESRHQGLGGTTKVWSGRWKLFDTIDFTKRAWVPLSGWPITEKELEPCYAKAAQNFHGIAPSELKVETISPTTRSLCSQSTLTPTFLWTMPKKYHDVGSLHTKNLEESERIFLYLGATLLSLESDGHTITKACVATKDKKDIKQTKEIYVKANTFILAAGGIENARILLLAGLGGPATGKYFMDHPKGVLGNITLSKDREYEKEWLGIEQEQGSYRIGFRLSDFSEEDKQTLNPYVQFEPLYPPGLAARLKRKLSHEEARKDIRTIRIMSYFEQQPVAENAVTLSKNTDTFGRPLPHVSWQLSPLDVRSMFELHTALYEEVKASGLGTLSSTLFSEQPDLSSVRDASHHMGTTRMGTDPETSVVDANCKVHTIDNLYIAGSSVFPTSGHANPTATIIALALRLGHHVAHGS